ncbi:nucleoporin NDC1-like isoform X2 [Antedon mediterranea]
MTMLLPFFAAVYSLLLAFDPLHPITWLSEWIFFIFSFKMIGMVTILIMSCLFVTFLNVRHITVIPVIRRNRLSFLLDLIEPMHALQICAITLYSALTAWFISAQLGTKYSTLIDNCPAHIQGLCLNEKHVVVVIHSGFIGFIFAVQFFLQHEYVMDFSPVQQRKFCKVRDFIYPNLIKCGIASMKHTLYFYLSYFFLGCFVKSCLLSALQLNGTMDTPLNSLHGFVQFSLLWKLWLVATGFTFVWKLGVYLFKIYNSESYPFLIDTPYAEQLERCLHSVMSTRAPSLVRHLAFLDLSLLSRHDVKKRIEVFSLSQPGHHSHNWNRISAECLSTVYCLTNQLTAYNQKVMITGASNGESINSAKQTDISQGTPQTPRYRTVQSLGPDIVQSPYSSFTQKSLHPPRRGQNGQLKVVQVTKSYVKNWFETASTNWIEVLKHLQIVVYLTNTFPDFDQGMVFRESQLQQWALEGLSNLVVASYDEDTFGVVQQSLPDVISALFGLHSALCKYTKLNQRPTSIHTKSTISEQDTAVYKLQNSVMEALKTAIHRIVARFGQHLKGIQLSTEDQRKLSQFFNYIE